MRPLTIGATIVAFGTSAPEFIVSMAAGLDGETEIAISNVIGSNIANIALVLGLAALIRAIPVDRRVLSLEYPVAVIATALLPWFAADGDLTRTEGGYLAIGFLAFMAFYVIRARAKGTAGGEIGDGDDVSPSGSMPLNLLLMIVGLAMLKFGADLVVESGIELAARFGMSKSAVGATIIAIGTSLPEVATSAVAAIRGQHGIAIGNVLGSNVFNVLFVLGPAALITGPLTVGDFERESLLYLMLALTAALFPLMRFGKTISRIEGVLLLGAYGYFLWLVQQHGRG